MKKMNAQNAELWRQAEAARQNAYAPYSGYRVGAALRTRSGKVFTGVNIENAAYPSGICAERVAIFKAVSAGERDFETLMLVTENGGMPCGACRQVMAEFALDMRVVITDASGQVLQEMTVRELLPGAFTSRDLQK